MALNGVIFGIMVVFPFRQLGSTKVGLEKPLIGLTCGRGASKRRPKPKSLSLFVGITKFSKALGLK